MEDICKKIKPQFDHIIVGQGLAGTCLALQLIRQGKKIIVFDEPEKNRASAVAGGLFNPITGKRLTKSWNADEIFAYLFTFYKEAELSLDRQFFYPQPVYQPFISIEEQNDWMARSEGRELKNLIDRVFTSSAYGSQSYDEFGGIRINQTGYLDTNLFMRSVRNLLEKQHAYQEKFFNSDRLRISNDKVSYENLDASSIIFCQGIGSLNGPIFGWVPIIPLKGETITISLSEKPKAIFNRGVYILPRGIGNHYLVGATYKPNDSTDGVTSEAKAEMEEKATSLIKMRFLTITQNWGVRPSTKDRRPILGSHPLHKNVVIFNGLGTKGVSLAPYFSDLLANWLEGKAEIPWEVNIERFKALYSN
jgi:glycine oxidase